MNRASVFFIAFFTSLVTAAGTSYWGPRLWSARDKQASVVVPSMVGLTEADARGNLKALGLVLTVGEREPHAQARPDTIVRQALPPGQRIPRGQPVSVTLAIAMPAVPDVSGKAVEEATRLLEAAGYAVQVGAALYSPAVAKGLVVSQSPKAGTALEKKSAVVIQPSAGPESLEVPKLVGLRLPAAKASIEKAGFKVGAIQWTDLAETPTYLVLRQTPEPGVQATPGVQIALTVNSGD